MKKTILLLGATGSIGSQTLEIIRKFPNLFSVVGFAVNRDSNKIKELQNEFNLKDSQIFIAQNCDDYNYSIVEFIRENKADIYVNSISGMAGIIPTLEIIKQKNPLCLANKESLVAKGETIMKTKLCKIIPIDSEHSSMAHLLSKVDKDNVKSIWLTASGGPFRDPNIYPKESFNKLTAKDALKHPTWSMGAKISIDSATLMNKAFELIEAVRLFPYPVETYKIVIHPQSLIHAAVETKDGNVLLEASTPTMLLPIARSLFIAINKKIPPEFSIPEFNPFGKQITFEEVDSSRFPSLERAKKVLQKGEKMCEEFLIKNDEAVEDFLQGKISFADIFKRIGDY